VGPDRPARTLEPALPVAAEPWTTLPLPATRALLAEVVGWLRARDRERLLRAVAGWPPPTQRALRHLLTTQGLAPLVADLLDPAGGAGSVGPVPDAALETVAWLAGQLAQSRSRADRFADDLSALLAGAAAAGIPVLPMKGALIAFTRYREPGLRPMADLDLLVRPDDEAGLGEVLQRLGYRDTSGPEAGHGIYRRPDDRVVSLDGTHPDNPRAVEVHTKLRRSVWYDRGGVDVARDLWAGARSATLLGQPALVPSDEALLVSVASHATGHLLRGAGLLLHWVDVATLAGGGAPHDDPGGRDGAPSAGNGAPLAGNGRAAWTYPPVALAARAFPSAPLDALRAALAPAVGAGLVRLADRAPLDDRAGLNLRGVHLVRLGWLGARWQRWRPSPWLVRLAEPHHPYPLAYAAYLRGVAARGVRRAGRGAGRR